MQRFAADTLDEAREAIAAELGRAKVTRTLAEQFTGALREAQRRSGGG